MKLFVLILKNLGRNKARSTMTTLAVVALVAIFSMIMTFLRLMDDVVAEKTKDVKLAISQRSNEIAGLDLHYMQSIISPSDPLHQQLVKVKGFHPELHTFWHFIGFTLDPERKDKDLEFLMLATLPDKIPFMTDGLEAGEFDPRWVELMKRPPKSGIEGSGIVVGARRLKSIKKRLGDVFTTKSTTHYENTGLRNPIELSFEIVGVIPDESRWNDLAFVDFAYLGPVLKEKKCIRDGKMDYGWLQVDNKAAAEEVAIIIESWNKDLKCETASATWARFMEPMKDILWGIKHLLVPAILAVMTLILANTFSITVRERVPEMAVLKVLGFSGNRVLLIVLGECALVGTLAGTVGALATFGLVNGSGGFYLPGFPVMKMSLSALWWGSVIGLGAGLVGAIVPAWGARNIKPTLAFAHVA